MQIDGRSGDKEFWVVVADEAKAIIYSRSTRRGQLAERVVFTNDAGRRKTRDLISDKGGRSFDIVGSGRHTVMREKSGPNRHQAELFAREIAEYLSKIIHSGRSRGYALVAPPKFLGLLRNTVEKNCNVGPDKAVAKELVGRPEEELQRYLD